MSVPEQWIPGVGPNLVQASAGTGKTTWMVRTAVRLLLQDAGMSAVVRPDRLLAVTFTRAATAELKERIREALRQVQRVRDGGAPREHEEWMRTMLDAGGAPMSQRLDSALASIDRLAVTTIHGFCKGALEEFALECRVPVGLRFIEQDQQYRDEAVADEWRSLTWESDRISRFVMGERLSGDPKRRARWSPNELAKAARVVRQGIGAERPERVNREAVLEKLHSALHGAAAVWDEQRLRAFHSSVRWNTDGNTPDDVGELCVAIGELRAGGDPVTEHVARWARTRVTAVARKSKATAASIAGEPFLDACEVVHMAHVEASAALWQDAVLSVAERMERAMERDRVAGFDEMIGFLQRAISDQRFGEHIRRVLAERYDAVLVDEFQDTDWAQWNIFSTTFEIRPLVLVGDPKQSIYGFRGADITAYRDAHENALKYGKDRVFSLDTNYRSDKSLVAATEILFAQTSQPFGVEKDVLDFEAVRAARSAPSLVDPLRRPMVLVDFGQDGADDQERKTSAFIAAEIARILRDPSVTYHGPSDDAPRRLRPRDIAILVSANRQAEPLLAALRNRRIAAVSGTTGDIAASVTWQDVFMVIAAIDDPANPRVVRRALASSLGGWTARELAALEQDGITWRELLERLAEARRDWASHGVLTALMRLANDWKARETLAAYPDGERRLTDFRHIVSLLQDAEREGHRNPALLRSWARSFAAEIDRDAEYRQQHLESDEDAVTISTVHAAKGLEWPVVFCGYLWKSRQDRTTSPRLGRFTDGARRIVFSDQPLVPGEIPGDSALSESLRLAYVALTRARSRTYVIWAKGKRENNGAIHHLLDAAGSSPTTVLADAHPDLIARLSEDDARTVEVPAGGYGDASSDVASARIVALTSRQRRSWTVSSYTRFTKGFKTSVEPIEVGPLDDAEAATDDSMKTNQLPGGAHTGNALHELFEQLDFTTISDSVTLDAAIHDVLARYALPAAGVDVVRRMVTATLSTPIPGAPKPLAAVPAGRTLREWRFDLSMERVSAARLAEVFREHGQPWLADSYAPLLTHVARTEIDGFLTGIVDLVAELDGRWWIVDWKSNTLGPTASSYGEPACRRAMIHEHYVLQYHIYVVALHRFLRSRLGPSYDYDRDFGGVGYAFLRGLAMGAPSWFTDRPSSALVDALDASIGGYSG